ncbi:HU family DNA-binding protein [Bacillus cereus]|uniref:HU family DNA-binding protein n=1 Tax=Bacillus cereus group TaxID=86661 RepID=UPI000C28235A|nr:HU family DNA-binding protein [Bacillus cereus]
MNKTELIQKVAMELNLSKKEVNIAVDTVFQSIQNALKNEEKVQIIGFGTFEVRERAAREGRNPHTGASLILPARKAPAFKAGKALKEAVNAE